MSLCALLFISKEHPHILDWQLPEWKKLPTSTITDVEYVQEDVSPLNSNPRGSNGKLKLTGAAIFLTCIRIAT